MIESLDGVFVTGTDTDVGKTVVSAWLATRWGWGYWKPVQSGTVEGSDSAEIARLVPGCRIYPPAYAFRAPLAPHFAARREGGHVDLAACLRPETSGPLVVEGAGGVLVPLNGVATIIDLMGLLRLPAVVVARTRLGTINHTLLTLEALRRRHIPILGVVLNGRPDPENREAIERFGAVAILGELTPLDKVTPETMAVWPDPRLPQTVAS